MRIRLHFTRWQISARIALAVSMPFNGAISQEQNPADAADPWTVVPKILERIVPPRFPARDFEITRFGAAGDGATDCTQAFREAIAACHRAGGGRVVVPPGAFRTGAIHLKSGVNLHVSRDATIQFSTNTHDYLPVVFTRFESTEVMNYSPFIYAYRQQNIAITGEGTLDGQASLGVWHKWGTNSRASVQSLVQMGDAAVPVSRRVFGPGHYLRPNFVQPVHCRNVLIEGVRIVDSPMWVLNPVYCTNVTIRGVRVDVKGQGFKAANTDGCDPDSCRDVLIEDCIFNCDDDCIAIKAGRDADGRRVNLPCENIVIRNCEFRAGHGGVTAGSETAAGIRNVFAADCRFDSPDLRMAIRLKTSPRRGGGVENFFVRDSRVKNAVTGIHMTMKYDRTPESDTMPYLRNIQIQNVVFEQLKQAVFIEGFSPTARVEDVLIESCRFVGVSQASMVTNAARVKFRQVAGVELNSVP